MGKKSENCLFCDIDPNRIIVENDLAYAVHDGYPVIELHALEIPKRDTETYRLSFSVRPIRDSQST
jgi:diadenosine tetraphosphate (Ap4A) HIT family hydrolase